MRFRLCFGIPSFAVLAIVLLSLGCGDHGATRPGAFVPLRVHVIFPEAPAAKPSAPAQQVVIDQVRAFAWEALPNETEVLRAQASVAIAPEDTAFGLELSVPPADLYRVRVEALGSGLILYEGEGYVEGVGSGETSTVTLVLRNVQPPLAPSDLTALPVSESAIDLSWRDNADNETGYRMLRRVAGEVEFTEVTQLLGSFTGTLTFTDTGLEDRTTYEYRVRAEGTTGVSDWTTLASAHTPIRAPGNLAAATLSSAGIQVTWEFTSRDPAGFQLDRRRGDGPWSDAAFPGPTDRSFADGDLQPRTTYTYRLRAFDGADTSGWCPEASGSTADLAPVCSLSEGSHDFGTLPLLSGSTWSFTVTNTGGGTLAGTVSLGSCAAFSLISGDGSYSLTAGQSHSVTVGFTPTTSGVFACQVSAGTGCSPVALAGAGEEIPLCDVQPASLDFGTVVVASENSKSLVITNTGGGTLSGTVSLPQCAGFTLISGGGAFSLGAGQTRPITVGFSPRAAGPYACQLALGTACGTVSITGTAETGPECYIDSQLLAFGAVDVRTDASKTFVIINSGGGTLAGTVSLLDCSAFTLVRGAGNFSLGADESREVEVRFAPPGVGKFACTVTTGSGCPGVSLTGDGVLPPDCSVSVDSLDFGAPAAGVPVRRSFTITNGGGGILSGPIIESCVNFGIVDGPSSFSLGPQESAVVTVEYRGQTAGGDACTIGLGSVCSETYCVVHPGPVCSLSTNELDFGAPPAGVAVQRDFTITNTGGGFVTGSIVESCSTYSIVSGGGSFSLGAGASRVVTVRHFSASGSGGNCNISLGSDCGQVSCTAQPEPVCSLSTENLDFGTVTVGYYRDAFLTITNIGGGVLSGDVSENCPGFTLVSGGGAYDLGTGQSRNVTARLEPSTGGLYACTIQTGNQCKSVPVTGSAAVCSISPGTFINLGTTSSGFPLTEMVTVTNTGEGVLEGIPTANCSYYSITDDSYEFPATAFSLGPGQSYSFVIWFTPPTTNGTWTCNVSLGPNCPAIFCTASQVDSGKPVK